MMLFLFVPMLLVSFVGAIGGSESITKSADGVDLFVNLCTFGYLFVNTIVWGYLTLYSVGVVGGAW